MPFLIFVWFSAFITIIKKRQLLGLVGENCQCPRTSRAHFLLLCGPEGVGRGKVRTKQLACPHCWTTKFDSLLLLHCVEVSDVGQSRRYFQDFWSYMIFFKTYSNLTTIIIVLMKIAATKSILLGLLRAASRCYIRTHDCLHYARKQTRASCILSTFIHAIMLIRTAMATTLYSVKPDNPDYDELWQFQICASPRTTTFPSSSPFSPAPSTTLS